MYILVINIGSSTMKCALFLKEEPIWEGLLDWSENQTCLLKIQSETETIPFQSLRETGKILLERLWNDPFSPLHSPDQIQVIGHRIVHGGTQFSTPTIVTKQVKEAIHHLSFLAPLHNLQNLEGIEIAEKLFPSVPQIAVFDTAFHSHMPETSFTYAGPYSWREKGIRRFGFHGISHEYCMEKVSNLLNKDPKDLKILSCHLGNGSSLAAISYGISIDTTMGFTPLEGLMMGTRSGSIDPGILIYLLKQEKCTANEIEDCLQKQSGLKGICGNSDMREILKQVSFGNQKASLALDLYIHLLKRNMGAMLAILEECDAISFTGGIGENVPIVREKSCTALKACGVVIDLEKNISAKKDSSIHSSKSKIPLFVIQAQEELAIAQKCEKIISRSSECMK